jgi:hypothetical protein
MRNDRNLVLLAILGMIAVCGAAGAGSLEPPGPPAPTMKDLDDVEPRVAIRNDFVTLTPIVISFPGSYYLAEDVFAFPGAHGIEITASNVTLDLNGFSVIGNTEVGSLDGIHADGEEEIVVRNGSVRLFFEGGINFKNSPYCAVENVRAISNNLSGGLHVGINMHTSSRVIDSVAASNGWTGIHAESGSIIRGCHARDNLGHGIEALMTVIESNVVRGNDTGISASWSLIRGNVMSANNLNLNNFIGTDIDNEFN